MGPRPRAQGWGGSLYNTSILSTIHKSKVKTTVQREGQVYTIDLYAKKIQEIPERWVFFVRERKKKKIYHVREDPIKPRCRVQVPPPPHPGTIPHHERRFSKQPIHFPPCLLATS